MPTFGARLAHPNYMDEYKGRVHSQKKIVVRFPTAWGTGWTGQNDRLLTIHVMDYMFVSSPNAYVEIPATM